MKTLSHQIMALAIMLCSMSLSAYADIWPDAETGITWTYTVLDDGTASLGGGSMDETAIPKETGGTIIVPEEVNGLTVTGLMDYAFYNCNVEEIIFDSPFLSQGIIGKGLFRCCFHLKTIKNLDYLNISKSTSLDEMFSSCSRLTTIDGIGAWDTSNIISMNETFLGCWSLNEDEFANLSLWDTRNLKSLKKTFCECYSLKDIHFLNSWNVNNLENLYGTFQFCLNLEGGYLDNWSLKRLKDFTNTFELCSHLGYVCLPNVDFSEVEWMQGTFKGCSSLQLVKLGTANYTDCRFPYMYETFAGCSYLDKVDLSNFKCMMGAYSPEYLDKVFVGCTNLYEVRLPNCIGESKDYENSYECLGEEIAENWFKEALLHQTFDGCINLKNVVGMGLKNNNWESRYSDFLHKSILYNPYDVNEDGSVDISDVVKIVNHILSQ